MRKLVYEITNLLKDINSIIYKKISICEDATFEYRIFNVLLKCRQNLLKNIELSDLKKEKIRITELMLDNVKD